jgi:hypothetical protein
VSINEIMETEGSPERRCETCSSRVVMPGDPEAYFAFIPNLPRLSSSPSIASSPSMASPSSPARDSSPPSRPSRDSFSGSSRRSEPLLRTRSSAHDVLQVVRANADFPSARPSPREDTRGLLMAVAIVVGVLAIGFAALLLLL